MVPVKPMLAVPATLVAAVAVMVTGAGVMLMVAAAIGVSAYWLWRAITYTV